MHSTEPPAFVARHGRVTAPRSTFVGAGRGPRAVWRLCGARLKVARGFGDSPPALPP